MSKARLFFTERVQEMAKFKPGKSGNPRGKPKGARDRRSVWREKLGGELDAVLERVVAAAKAGDMQAISLILSRTCPPLRARGEPVALPALSKATSFSGLARTILASVANGEISPDQGSDLLAAVTSATKIVESDELAARLAALEERYA